MDLVSRARYRLNKLKSVLSIAPVLRFYDTSLPTTLQVDASRSGLGACLVWCNRINQWHMPHVLSQVQKSVTPKLRKSSWQSFMGVRDLTCTRKGQKLKYSQIISPEKVFSKSLFSRYPLACKEWDLVCKSIILKWDMFQGGFFILQILYKEHLISPMFLLTMICIATWSISFIM